MKIWYEEGWGLERLGMGGDRPYPFSLNSNNNQSLNLDSYSKCKWVYKIEDMIWRGWGNRAWIMESVEIIWEIDFSLQV